MKGAKTMTKLTLKSKQAPPAPHPAAPPDIEREAKDELDAATAAFKAKKQNEQAVFTENTDSEYWVALCFQTRAQKEEFLAKIGVLSEGDKYLDGLAVARAMGITIEAPTPPRRKLNIGKRWQGLVKP